MHSPGHYWDLTGIIPICNIINGSYSMTTTNQNTIRIYIVSKVPPIIL